MGNGYRFASTECPIEAITDAGIVFMVTRLDPGYFMQCIPMGGQRVGPIRDNAVGPRPVPGGTLAIVDYRVFIRDVCEVPLGRGVADPAYGEEALLVFSIDLPSEVVGKVVGERKDSRDVYVSDSIRYKGVTRDLPGVKRATEPNDTFDTSVSRVPVDIVEKVIPYPIYVHVVISLRRFLLC